jgi:phosphate transport system permease protein
LLVEKVVDDVETLIAVSPRANSVLALSIDGHAKLITLDNEHPEVSWHSLWQEVWYESRDKPEYIWQSSSASNDFEPKFSLSPLTFGTIKAAFYAMMVAVPLAIMGAIYTAYFMSPKMRRLIKPTIEIMEALPTVILGFLAGLWLAPIVEGNLPGVFSILIMLPVMTILTAYLWTKLPSSFRESIPEGCEAAILVPVVILVGVVSMMMSPTLELWLFNGDMPRWLDDIGVGFDQRNSLVVGLVMGFAVIPTIFSITEDAIFGVPKHLTIGSLALGATPWQTLTRVVLLTASPGIFSAVMIGLGRAVGETMIVLMATGNTPIMDFNIFEGFRALSANIAVEMPEAEVASTHYRVLFLAALVLFMATFIFNTIAEVVRQRLRVKYSSL